MYYPNVHLPRHKFMVGNQGQEEFGGNVVFCPYAILATLCASPSISSASAMFHRGIATRLWPYKLTQRNKNCPPFVLQESTFPRRNARSRELMTIEEHIKQTETTAESRGRCPGFWSLQLAVGGGLPKTIRTSETSCVFFIIMSYHKPRLTKQHSI